MQNKNCNRQLCFFEEHRIKVSLYTSFKNLSLHFNNWYEKTLPLINGSCFP